MDIKTGSIEDIRPVPWTQEESRRMEGARMDALSRVKARHGKQ